MLSSILPSCTRSLTTRVPKLTAARQNALNRTKLAEAAPAFSLMLGLVGIPLGAAIQGMLGGVLIGAGVGGLAAAAWDFGRLRFVAWRRGRAERRVDR
jgi:hypothetical protein